MKLMEKPTLRQENIQTTPPIASASKPNNLLLIGLGALLLLSLGSTGFLFYQNSQLKKQIAQLQTTPTAAASPSLTPTITALSPTETPKIQPVDIPSDWKEFTGTSPLEKLTTTLSLPKDYTFGYHYAEWFLVKSPEEVWDYSTSIMFDSESNPKNRYDGGSRRNWYEKYLKGEFLEEKPLLFKEGEIISVAEHKIGTTSYLEVTVKGGMNYVANIEKHYLYAQNGILHIIRPASEKANSPDSILAKNIGLIFFSLKSRLER